MRYSYQAEKLHVARRALMLPHSRGEHDSIAEAFRELSHAFHNLDETQLDSTARGWVQKLKKFMDTSDTTPLGDDGLYSDKASTFSIDEKIQISTLVDELASWFDRADND